MLRAASLLALLGVLLSVCVDRTSATWTLNGDGSMLCDVLQMDGFYGSQPRPSSYETCNWQRHEASIRFCQDSYGYQHQDSCKWQCSNNHTLTISVFSTYHTFNLLVNGYVLTANGWVGIPSNYSSLSNTVSTWGNWASNSSEFAPGVLTGIYTPLDIGINSTYYTGQSNTPNSPAPNTWTCPLLGNTIQALSSPPITFAKYAPIYKIPFPYWNCNPSSVLSAPSAVNTIKNYVSVNVKWPGVVLKNIFWPYQPLAAVVCAQPNGQDFVFTRNCSATTGNTSLITPIGSNARGDPQFAGLRGQDYQVHGVDGGIYNVISDKYMQLNSKFVFLTGPRPCPIMPSTGRKSVACFAHAGSYLGNLALRTNADDRVLIESGPAERGLAAVEVNGERLIMGDNVTIALSNGRTGYVYYQSTHEVVLVAGLFEIEIENSDSFLNLRSALVRSSNWQELVDEKAHGLLGQTWEVRTGKSAIEGKVDDYMLMSDDLYGTDFLYNRFDLTEGESQE